jgi:BMFP domain-containing protein YqiC
MENLVDKLDPLHIGDIFYLNVNIANVGDGYLCGNSSAFNVGVNLMPKWQGSVSTPLRRDSLTFEENVFRIYPALYYRQRNEYEANLASQHNKIFKKLKIVSRDRIDSENNADIAAMKMLEKRMEEEEAQNAMVCDLYCTDFFVCDNYF